MEEEIQSALYDFAATADANPDVTDEEIMAKFPEFGNDPAKVQAAWDYYVTSKSGQYEEAEINSKFPEFFGEKKNKSSDSPSLGGDSNVSTQEPLEGGGFDDADLDANVDDISVFQDLTTRIKRGGLTTAAGIAGYPNYVRKLSSAIVLDKETLAELNSLPPSAREIVISGVIPTDNTAASAAAQNFLTDKAESLADKTIEFEGNIIDDFTSGNVQQGAYRIVQSAAESASSLALSAFGLPGIALIAMGAAAQKQEEQEREGKDINLRSVANSAISGTAEGYFERVTAGLFKRFGDVVRGIGDIAEEVSGSMIKEIAKSFGLEAGSEALTSLTQDLSDKFVGGDEVSFLQIVKNVIDSGMVGGFMGGTMGGATSLASYTSTKTRSKEVDKKINESAEKAETLKKEVREEMPDTVKEALNSEIENLNKEVVDLHKKEVAKAEKLSDSQVREVYKIDTKMEELNQQLIDVVNDETLSPETKMQVETSLRKNFDALEESKAEIVNNPKPENAITPAKIDAKKDEIRARDAESLVEISDADAYKQAVSELSGGESVVTPEAINKRKEEIKNRPATEMKSEADLYKRAIKELGSEIDPIINEEVNLDNEEGGVEEITKVEATKQAVEELSKDPKGVVTPEAINKRRDEILNGKELPKDKKKLVLFNDPNPETADIARKFKKDTGNGLPEGVKIDKIDRDLSKEIADEYEKMEDAPNNPEVRESYEAMAKETNDQHKAIIDSGYEVEIWEGKGEPYASSEEMIKDVRDNKHMWIFGTENGFGEGEITDQARSENVLLEDSGFKDKNGKTLLNNDVFRFVHDFFGHTERGNGFGIIGEENAWDVHARMYSNVARRAMTTETRGQNSWVNSGPQMRNANGDIIKRGEEGFLPAKDRAYAPQKMGLLPEKYSKIRAIPYNQKEVYETTDAKRFVKEQERANSKRTDDGAQVKIITEAEAQAILDEGGKLFLSSDGTAGSYVKKDGYMGGLFKDPTVNKYGAFKVFLKAMVDAGGRFGDAFATHLEDIYIESGFNPTVRMDFDEKVAPKNWKETNLKDKPDNVFFVYNPDVKAKKGDGIRNNNFDEAYQIAKKEAGIKPTKEEKLDSKVKEAEDRLFDALNAVFTKGIVSFNPNSNNRADVELANALINFVKAKLEKGAYSVTKLISDLKKQGFNMKDKHVRDLYEVAVDEGNTKLTLDEAVEAVKGLSEVSVEADIRNHLKESGFTPKIINLAITRGIVKSAISKSGPAKVERASVGLKAAVEKIRVAYNKGLKDNAKILKTVKKEATDKIFSELKGNVNLNQLKSLIVKVRDINEKNFDKKIGEIDTLIDKIYSINQDKKYKAKATSLIKTVRKQNNKGKFTLKNLPDIRPMLTAITSLKASEVPQGIRDNFVRVLSSIKNYNVTGNQPEFREVQGLYESLNDTFAEKEFISALESEIEVDNAGITAETDAENEAIAVAEYKKLIEILLTKGYNKSEFDVVERGLLFKLHKFLKESDLEGYTSKDLRNIAQQLQQTSTGSNAWMPTQKVADIVMRFQGELDTKTMEKESFSQKVSDMVKGPIPKSVRQIKNEVNKYDRLLKGYMSTFSKLFKEGTASYGRTIGLLVSAGATVDSQKAEFSKTFSGLIKKTKGNKFRTQTIFALYALEKRKLANPKNKSVFSAKKHKDAATVVNKKALSKIYDEFSKENGELDVEAIEKWMRKDKNKVVLWEEIQKQLSKANARRKSTAKHYEGETAEDIDWYTPVAGVKGRMSEIFSIENDRAQKGASIGGSNKKVVATKASPFNFDYFRNIKTHVDNSIEYSHIMPVLKQLEATQKAMAKSPVKTIKEDWSRIIFGVDDVDGVVNRHFAAKKSTGMSTKSLPREFIDILANNKIRSLLLSAFPRFVSDLGTNAFFTYSAYGYSMYKGAEMRKKNNSGDHSILSENLWLSEIFANYPSEQAGRDRGNNTSDIRGAQLDITDMHAFKTAQRSVMEAVADLLGHNKINDAGSSALGYYYHATDSPSMKIWKAAFSKSFPDFDAGAFTGKKQLDYREKNDQKIREAILAADKATRNLYNTPSSSAEKNTTLDNKRKGGVVGQAAELLLGFQYNENHGLWNAIYSMMPNFISKKGDLSFLEAAKNAYIITGRSLLYGSTQSVMLGLAVSALYQEDDDIDMELTAKRALAQYGSLLFLGNQNAFGVMAYQAAFEVARKTYFGDDVEDSLFYTSEPGLGQLGLLGMVAEDLYETLNAIYKLAVEEKEDSLTELRQKIMYQEILATMLGLTFGIKWKIVPKGVKKSVETEIINERARLETIRANK